MRRLESRAKAHAALGDPRRLQLVDELSGGDRTVAELAELVGMSGNLAAHHLGILEDAGLIERRPSEGDRRRRYVTLSRGAFPLTPFVPEVMAGTVAFVCTHNSARSQFAAALWEVETGGRALSAGTHPSATVHPKAVVVARELGVDLSSAVPGGYDRLTTPPDLVVSVCDLAREAGLPDAKRYAHWSVPDPVRVGTLDAFRHAFEEIAGRVEALTSPASGGSDRAAQRS